MARYQTQVFECDTNGCTVKKIGKDWKDVEGFHGTIREVDGNGGADGGEWSHARRTTSSRPSTPC